MTTLLRPPPALTAQHFAQEPLVPRFLRWLLLLLRCLLLAAPSALLLWLAFFPENQGWCAWFALVPLLILARTQWSTGLAVLAAWLTGLPLYVASLQWVRVAHPMMYFSWIGLAFYCSLYFPLTIWLLRRLDRLPGVPISLSLPVVWTALEYLRAHFLGGFPWYFLGHTQHDYLAIIQVADLGGVYAITFLMALCNGVLFEALCRWELFRNLARIPFSLAGKPVRVPAAVFGILLLITLGYGVWRKGQIDFAQGPTLALLQSNIDQGTRSARSNPSQQVEGDTPSQRMCRDLADLTREARRQPCDLIVWPETTCPYDWIEVAPGAPPLSPQLLEVQADRRQMLVDIARGSGTYVLLGLNCEQFTSNPRSEKYNSALLVDRSGRPMDRYDKIHCVPFGEFVPMRNTFPWMRVFSPYESDYSLTPGQRLTRFALPTQRGEFHFGVIICYEDSDPLLARHYVAPTESEPPVDFLINISNDGWFNGTEEHEQHLAICRFCAIESRRAVARAVNMGISAVIDGNGRIVALSGPSWAESKKVATTVTAKVPIDHRRSFYAAAGDWLPTGCAAFGLLGICLSYARRKEPAPRKLA